MKKNSPTYIAMNLLLSALLVMWPCLSYGAPNVVTGNAINLAVNDPVVFTTSPTDQNVAPGDTATFTVVVSPSSTTPISLQWQKDGVDISGATGTSYSITNVQAANAGQYVCLGRNIVNPLPAPAVSSGTATLTVGSSLTNTITASPSNTANPGTSIVLTSNPSGGKAPYAYQWKKDGVDVGGATGQTYTITAAAAYNGSIFTCLATDNNSATALSNAITIHVNVPITIATQPAGQDVVIGQSVAFNVGINADATTPVTYQWQKDGTDIAGATNATYSIANVANGDAGLYSVNITNICGTVTSNGAMLSVNGALTVVISTMPPAVQEGADYYVRVNPGTAVTYTANVSGGVAPYHYQWTRGGTAINGQTSATFQVPAAQNADEGTITCVVTDSQL